MNEIQMTFYSLTNLFDKGLWLRFLSALEVLLKVKMTHLDINDPIRKKISDLGVASEYICSIGEQEGSRRLFGKFGKSKVEITIQIFK